RQTTRTKRHLTAFGVGQFSMQILGQDSVQINTAKSTAGRKPASTKATGAAKYKHAETGATWIGRGARPQWLKDEIAAGKKLEDFLIS
ncbi:H-NS family nucleoid-associated regulatory protein, partial [Arthrobacter sp. NPDC080086]|uniref:H-NS histone family protein n=1 Tax=Arthrobacter sp. NPDC080086 TaxID=3155917 RepID=UPI00344D2945